MERIQQLITFFLTPKGIRCQEPKQIGLVDEDATKDYSKDEPKLDARDEDFDEEESGPQSRRKFKNMPLQFEQFMNMSLAVTKKVEHIKGFRFEFNQPVSQQFSLTHSWNIPMQQTAADPANPQQDPAKTNSAYYQLQAQYVGGSLNDLMQGHEPPVIISGKYESNGKLEGHVIKKLNDNVMCRLVGQYFKGSDLQYAQMNLNVEYQADNNTQAFKIGNGFISYSLMQSIGRKVALGLEFMHIFQRKVSFMNYVASYKNNTHDFKGLYLKHADMLQLCYQMHIQRKSYVFSSLGLKLSDQKTNSMVGIRQKFTNCEVQTQINSRGKLCTLFSVFDQIYSCKFCVIADYLKNNYKFGVGLSLGQQQM